MGRLEEAESHFRDLITRFPEASHAHGALARILQARGDDSAATEYARAVILDPGNLDALRNYALFLIERGDLPASLPLLRRLVSLQSREDDRTLLVRTLNRTGEGDEALRLIEKDPGPLKGGPEHIRALLVCGRTRDAITILSPLLRRQGSLSPWDFGDILARIRDIDPGGVIDLYHEAPPAARSPASFAAMLRGLLDLERYSEVTAGIREGSFSGDPVVRLPACEAAAGEGKRAEALALYDDLLADAGVGADDVLREEVLTSFVRFLRTRFTVSDATLMITTRFERSSDPVSLLAAAGFFASLGDRSIARSWYYHAYRADFFTGGLAYAKFLAGCAEWREAEKVFLYITGNVRRTDDLVRLAGEAASLDEALARMPRLTAALVRELSAKMATLSTRGRESLAVLLLLSASSHLVAGDTTAAKQACLEGLDILPAGSRVVHPADFLPLIERCKACAMADIPVTVMKRSIQSRERDETTPLPALLELDRQEQAVLSFLKENRCAADMDLRHHLGTRRVPGIVNRIMQKAAQKGITVIRKKGMGEHGEVYEYCGP